jgi:hypothetical protein
MIGDQIIFTDLQNYSLKPNVFDLLIYDAKCYLEEHIIASNKNSFNFDAIRCLRGKGKVVFEFQGNNNRNIAVVFKKIGEHIEPKGWKIYKVNGNAMLSELSEGLGKNFEEISISGFYKNRYGDLKTSRFEIYLHSAKKALWEEIQKNEHYRGRKLLLSRLVFSIENDPNLLKYKFFCTNAAEFFTAFIPFDFKSQMPDLSKIAFII